jgi:threonine aldolase
MLPQMEPLKHVIDLRSDTVTRPGEGMRHAMAGAEVGDDWYGEDPTVNRLQEEAAALLGHEAALFVPSGTMANQLSLAVHCQRGDEALVGREAHVLWHEGGAGAGLAGVQLTEVGEGGLFTADEIEAAVKPRSVLHPPTRLVCMENTHNRCGGRVWPLAQLRAACERARALGLRLHLDGARVWNAHVQGGASLKELCAPFDTVSVCFSKGLGAPMGSLLLGSGELIQRARRYRQMYGGGLRQAGIVAAAGLYALAHNLPRLAQDHEHAQILGRAVLASKAARLCAPVETNIVVFDLLPGQRDAAAVVGKLRERGVLVNAMGRWRVRAVTHLDVDRAACERAADILGEVLSA